MTIASWNLDNLMVKMLAPKVLAKCKQIPAPGEMFRLSASHPQHWCSDQHHAQTIHCVVDKCTICMYII